jgi:hypothetical protein
MSGEEHKWKYTMYEIKVCGVYKGTVPEIK